MIKFTPELKRKWVKALRSGKYTQGFGYLKAKASDPINKDTHCCLGVLGEILPKEKYFYMKGKRVLNFTDGEILSVCRISPFVALNEKTEIKLMEMNDKKSMSFSEIADWIEENLIIDSTKSLCERSKP